MKIATPLTVAQIRKLNKDGLYALGGVSGLSLKIQKCKKTYVYRYVSSSGRRRIITIGNFEAISLSEARSQAFALSQKVIKGLDPLDEKNAQKFYVKSGITFEEAVQRWLEQRDINNYYTNPREPRRILATFKRNLFPKLGQRPIDSIDAVDLYNAISQYWINNRASAKKLLTYTRQVFRFAIAMKLRRIRENPASMDGDFGVLLQNTPKDNDETNHMPALPFSEIPSLFIDLDSLYSMSARAVEFAILTATRSQATRLAKWENIDLEKGTWEIPVEDDKEKGPNRDRTIYLSSAARDLLKRLPRLPNQKFVFLSNRGHTFADMGLQMVLRRLHEAKLEIDDIGWIDPIESKKRNKPCPITVHGTARASFFTWARDDGLGNNRKFDKDAVDKCLLHSTRDPLKGAYDRSTLEQERREIMEAWGQYCYSKLFSKAKRNIGRNLASNLTSNEDRSSGFSAD